MKKINIKTINKINVQDIVKIAMILSMFLAVKWLNGIWNKDVFPGIKIQFTPLVLLMSSLIFGSFRTGTATFIFIFIIAWSSPTTFIDGITWVSGTNKIFGEYMLDYVVPLMSISIIPGLYKYLKGNHTYFITLSIALLIKLLSHFFAGIIFWGGYAAGAFGPAWDGFVYSYSIVANLLGMSFIIPATLAFAWPTVKHLKPRLTNVMGEKW